jgi:hypothetical protein
LLRTPKAYRPLQRSIASYGELRESMRLRHGRSKSLCGTQVGAESIHYDPKWFQTGAFLSVNGRPYLGAINREAIVGGSWVTLNWMAICRGSLTLGPW